MWVLKKSLCVKAVVERINSLGTESSRFSTVDYIPESFCIIDLKRHSEDRGGRSSDRLDPESHLSHIFFSATSSAYFCGRGKGIYDPWFPLQRIGNHFKFGSSAIIQERESRNFEHMRINFSTFLLPTLTSNLLKAAELLKGRRRDGSCNHLSGAQAKKGNQRWSSTVL